MRSPAATARQVARFAVTGALNTLIDYVLFMLLCWALRLPLSSAWIAKVLSGAAAMTHSFVLNRRWVFQTAAGGVRQLLRFLAVTLFGTFVVQLVGLELITRSWLLPAELVSRLVDALALGRLLPRAFVLATFAFGVATLASMTWSYLAYRRWVFPPTAAEPPPSPSAASA